MSSSDGLVDRMVEHVPEFKGYGKSENRRASDKMAREAWGKELRFGIEVLNKQLNANSKLGDSKKQVAQTVIGKLNLLVEDFDQLAGDISLFRAKDLNEDDIEAIVTLDLNLLTRSTAIKEKAIRTSREIASSPSWDREVDELYNKIKDLDETWKRRGRLMSTIGT